MKVVVQRVSEAKCQVDSSSTGEIGPGLVIFLGVADGDDRQDLEYLAEKISHLRIFGDDSGNMEHSVREVDGDVLVVPNFTLCADVNRGRRPSFDNAAPPDRAEELYEQFMEALSDCGLSVESGEFGAMMDVTVENDGPVTIVIDSESS